MGFSLFDEFLSLRRSGFIYSKFWGNNNHQRTKHKDDQPATEKKLFVIHFYTMFLLSVRNMSCLQPKIFAAITASQTARRIVSWVVWAFRLLTPLKIILPSLAIASIAYLALLSLLCFFLTPATWIISCQILPKLDRILGFVSSFLKFFLYLIIS